MVQIAHFPRENLTQVAPSFSLPSNRESARSFDFAALVSPFITTPDAEAYFMAEHFLIVDDDPDSTFLARRNLLQAFPLAEVEHAQNGPDALEKIGRQEFTAVITDFRMPRMDGLTLVRKIRELGHHMPIILRTAMEDLENQARAAGVDYVLPWFRWRDLGEIVRELIHCHTPGSESKS
jgi:CheY-like chemotaxis protein